MIIIMISNDMQINKEFIKIIRSKNTPFDIITTTATIY